MANSLPIDPTRVYQINGDAVKIQVFSASLSVANNQVIVAAATGKITRVMGWLVNNATTTGGALFTLHSSGGHAIVTGALMNANNAAGYTPERQPIIDAGYDETVVGDSLLIDIAVAAQYVNIYYVQYTVR